MGKKILILLFVTVCVLSAFAGCAKSGDAVMTYKKYSISEDMYRYWLISWKNNFVENYSDIEDTDEYWNSPVSEGSDQTNGEYVRSNIETRIRYYLIGQALFDEYNLSLDKDAKVKIKGYVDDKIAYYGGRSACNSALEKTYGISLATLEKIYTFEEKYLTVFNYLYGSDGKLSATAQEIDDYYHNYYARAKYVMFLKDCKKKYDENGKVVTDSEGHVVYEDLTDEEKAQVKQDAQTVFDDVKADKKFDKYNDAMDYYMEKYMEEHVSDILETYPNGFYITADEYLVHTAAVTEAVFDMEDGEVRFVENESCYFVIKKYPLIDKAYASSADSGQFSYLVSYANSEKFSKDFAKYGESITENDEIRSKYKFNEL